MDEYITDPEKLRRLLNEEIVTYESERIEASRNGDSQRENILLDKRKELEELRDKISAHEYTSTDIENANTYIKIVKEAEKAEEAEEAEKAEKAKKAKKERHEKVLFIMLIIMIVYAICLFLSKVDVHQI